MANCNQYVWGNWIVNILKIKSIKAKSSNLVKKIVVLLYNNNLMIDFVCEWDESKFLLKYNKIKNPQHILNKWCFFLLEKKSHHSWKSGPKLPNVPKYCCCILPLLPIPPKTSKNICYCSAMGIVKSLVTSANL